MNKNKTLKKWLIAAIVCAIVAFAIPMLTISFFANDDRNIVIVLDPGHGGADVGAVSDDGRLYEADLNLAIALACRDELLKYDGVDVYMTHTGVERRSTVSLNDRINYAGEVNADILVSLHCNDSDNSSAHGSEVYVSHSTFSEKYNQNSTELAIGILQKFGSMGLRVRGVKTRLSNGSRMYYHPDGSVEVGDYYAVIGGTIKKYGIPGILVEHGFVTGDEGFLSSEDNLRALGAADAAAIAEYFDLPPAGTKREPEPETDESVADEPEAIIVTDADIASASDVSSRIMTMTSVADASMYEDMVALRRDYEKLSVPAKTLVDPQNIDALYKTLLELDAQVHPIRLSVTDNTELDVNRITHTISGVSTTRGALRGTTVAELSTSLITYVDTAQVTGGDVSISGSFILIVDEQGNVMDIGEQICTGTRAQLWKDGELLDELTVIITCDTSCDGEIDSQDQYVVEEYIYNGVALSEPAMLAADANGDGLVTTADIEYFVHEIVSQENE